jgi:sugar lactone lactonase YvrE
MKRLVVLAVVGAFVALLAAPAAAAEAGRLRILAGLYADSKGASLKAPEGVAVAGARLAVADTGNGRIVEYALDQERVEPKAEYVLDQLPRPARMAFTAGGDLLVLDSKLRKIGRVGGDGAFRGFFALPEQAVPRSLDVSAKGTLRVLDVGRGKVLTVDDKGAVTEELDLPADRTGGFWSDLAADDRGDVFVLDSVGRRVLVAKAGAKKFEPFGEVFPEDFEFGTALAVDGAGRVYVADQNGGEIFVLAPDGTFRSRQAAYGWKEGMLRYPSALAIGAERLFVADRANNRVEMFGIGP